MKLLKIFSNFPSYPRVKWAPLTLGQYYVMVLNQVVRFGYPRTLPPSPLLNPTLKHYSAPQQHYQ